MTPALDHLAGGGPTVRTVMLTGSPPLVDENTNNGVSTLAVEEAIISLARAAYANNVRLVYAGHPYVALLLATIATEYTHSPYAAEMGSLSNEPTVGGRPLLAAFVARGWAERYHYVDELELLHRAGYFALAWGDKRVDGIYRAISITQPDALVCISGSADELRTTVDALYEMRLRVPIYTMATTGGAADEMSIQADSNDNRIVAFDRRVLQELEERLLNGQRDSPVEVFVQGVAPYPLIMQRLIATIIGNTRGIQ